MEYLKLKNGVLISALALALSACGSSSSDAPVVTAGLSGKVVDGYVSGATVTMDLNDDRICSASEPQVTTNSLGGYSFTAAQNTNNGQHMVCSSGGVDISSGIAFVGQLKSPAGSTMLSPLTSLVQAEIDRTLPAPVVGTASAPTPAAINAAMTTTATNLSLSGVDLITVDPVAAAVTKPELLQTTAAVQVLLVQATNSVAAAGGLTSATAAEKAEIFQNAVLGVSKAVTAASAPINLISTTTASTTAVNAVIKAAVTETVTSLKTSTTSTVASALANVAPASVAAVSASNITKLTQQAAVIPAVALATAAESGVVSASRAAQEDTTAASVVTNLVSLLSTTVASAVSSSSSVNFETIAANVTAGHENFDATVVNNAIASAVAAVNTAASSTASWVAVSAPSTPVTIAALTDVFALSNPTINTTSFSSTASSVSVTGPMRSASLKVDIVGTPAAPSSSAKFGVSLTEVNGNRKLSMIIDKLELSYAGNAISAVVPATANLIVSGTNAAGTNYTATLQNVAANSFSVSNGSALTVNFADAIAAVKGQNGFSSLDLVKGTFNVEATLSGVNLAKYSNGTSGTVIPAAFTGVSAGTTGLTGKGVKFQVEIK